MSGNGDAMVSLSSECKDGVGKHYRKREAS